MMTPFEEHLLHTLFPDMLAWSSDSVATYVLHRHDGQSPLFFKKLTDEVLEFALTHQKDFEVYSVKTDGSVDDVTAAWTRVFEKHQSTHAAIDTLLARWTNDLPADLATMELKMDGVTLGYFPKPTLEMLRCTHRVSDVNRVSILAIHTNGVVKDMRTEWTKYLVEYTKLRLRDM